LFNSAFHEFNSASEIDDFVDHWNEKHQEITLKKKDDKNVAKLKIADHNFN
jgi:hypothetical protein